jgi:hypothetical protein
MSQRTKIELFPKSDWTEDQVKAVQAGHLASGAVSCELTSDENNYILTTVWRVIE